MREFIVEADGGSRGNPGPAGYGAVVSDAATGETLTEAAEYIGVATNNVAEYRGLLAGLRAAHALDPAARVHVRMDSKLVIEQMSGRWKIKHPAMKPLATEARAVLPPDQVFYEWIPRERNKHADRLANEAMDAGAKGEQWSPSRSRAALDTPPAVPEPTGPPGDATAGAARARAALAEGRATPARPTPAEAPAAGPASPTGPSPTEAAAGGRSRPASGASASGGPAESAAQADSGPGSSSAVSAGGGPSRPASATAPGPASGASASGGPAESAAQAGSGPASSSAGQSSATEAAGGGSSDAATTARQTASAAASGAAAEALPVSGRQPSAPGWSSAPDLGAPATFVLLRHGETPLTPQKRFSGSGGTDPSLSDAGREQARRVAEALARRGTVQAVVASPLARTRETAGIVAARLGLDVTVDDGLRETDFGAWEGLTFGEVRERHPEDLNAWLADPEAHPTGGGESFAETATRIAATRDKLVAAHAGRTVLLVTHVTPIKTFVRLALGAPLESLFRMELSAASLSAVAYYADGNASVRLFNETSHLRP
ncbi:histidine phosphatase family protein [Streptomyces sp. PanSC9]|uniref:histidine phosphatase family protein n=1 Tax=Streptomyces sp. PanSC9 TaxID=1520461 RepID=UPI000F4A5A18|nr:histidine phosphatase family protein [Streptomyces sp. PanSC9]ROP53557.1 putative phosphoglycerate mutase [Streptomyces sp. PanSC9]